MSGIISSIVEMLGQTEFINFAIGLTLLMIANAITGIMKAIKSDEFSWSSLLEGLSGYLGWLLAATFSVIGFQIYGGELEVTVNGNTITFLAAIEVAKKAVYAYWGYKAIQNFLEYSQIDTSKVEVKYPEELTIKDLYESNDTVEETASDEEEKG